MDSLSDELNKLQFTDAQFFVCSPDKINDLTRLLLDHHNQCTVLLASLKDTRDEENRQVIYKQAALLHQEMCKFMHHIGYLIICHLSSKSDPRATKLANLQMKIFYVPSSSSRN